MTPAETVAVGALLDAISGHLPAPGPGPEQDVRLACAHIIGCGCDTATLTEMTTLLNAPPAVFAAACQSCGNTLDLDTVHVPARVGVAARVEHYCHDATSCHQRRHAHLTATSAVTG